MPNGDDTVRVQRPDGKTGTIPKSSLAQAQKNGWKVLPKTDPGAVSRFGMDVSKGMGLDPQGLVTAGAEGKSQIAEMAKQAGGAFLDYAKRGLHDPFRLATDPFDALASGLTKALGIPDKGSALDKSQYHAPNFGQAVGAVASILGGAETSERAGARASTTGKAAVRDLVGVGEIDVQRRLKSSAEKQAKAESSALERFQKETQEAADKHAKAVESAKEKHAQAVQTAREKAQKTKAEYSEAYRENLRERVQASAKETTARIKQQVSTGQGPVKQYIDAAVSDAAEHTRKIERQVFKTESAKWDAFTKSVGDPAIPTTPLREALDKAQGMLTGETVPVFKKIINEIGEEDADLKKMLDNMAPEVRERARQAGVAGTDDIPLSTMRKIYTRLSRSIGASELPTDVARATGTVLDAADDSIAQAIKKKGGQGAVSEYRQLQADWRKYRQTFSDKNAPLRKLMEAKDPDARLKPITGDTGARAIDDLGQYRNLGADPNKLGRIRAIDTKIQEMSGSAGTMPAKPEPKGNLTPAEVALSDVPKGQTPKLKIPDTKDRPQTVEEARRQILDYAAGRYSTPPTWMQLIFPHALGGKMIMKHALNNPRVVDWLASEAAKK
jgi:hypothetical protein